MELHKLLNLIEKPKSRLLITLAVSSGILLAVSSWNLESRVLATWDAGVFCLLALTWLMMLSANAQQTCDRARRQEVDHRAIFMLVIVLAFSSLFAIATVLAKHKDSFTLEVGLSIVGIACSWLLMHTIFVLHYAAAYYRVDPVDSEVDSAASSANNSANNSDSHSETDLESVLRGLQFSDTAMPDYLDFVYFAFTLGMTSQTSDTAIVTSAMRRLTLGHTVVSFYFYSVILALSISIVSGLI